MSDQYVGPMSDQYVGPIIRNQGDRLLISGTDVHLKLNKVSNVLLYLSISIFRN